MNRRDYLGAFGPGNMNPLMRRRRQLGSAFAGQQPTAIRPMQSAVEPIEPIRPLNPVGGELGNAVPPAWAGTQANALGAGASGSMDEVRKRLLGAAYPNLF